MRQSPTNSLWSAKKVQRFFFKTALFTRFGVPFWKELVQLPPQTSNCVCAIACFLAKDAAAENNQEGSHGSFVPFRLRCAFSFSPDNSVAHSCQLVMWAGCLATASGVDRATTVHIPVLAANRRIFLCRDSKTPSGWWQTFLDHKTFLCLSATIREGCSRSGRSTGFRFGALWFQVPDPQPVF